MAEFALYDVVKILGEPVPDDLPPTDRPPVGDFGTIVDIVEGGTAYLVEVTGEDGATEWLGRLTLDEMEFAGRPGAVSDRVESPDR